MARRPFAIEIWDMPGRTELRLGVIYPVDGAIPAFDTVKGVSPRDEMTLRQGARVVCRHARPGAKTPAGGRLVSRRD